MGLDSELPKALESLAGKRVFNSGSVTGRRIDGEKDVTSGRSRHFQFLLQMQLSMGEMIKMSRFGFKTKGRDEGKQLGVQVNQKSL